MIRIKRSQREEQYLVIERRNKHPDALLKVVVEPLPDQRKRFHVFTIVYYRNWTGPVYFNVIRPFHRLVVISMVLAGVRKSGASYPDHVPVARELLE